MKGTDIISYGISRISYRIGDISFIIPNHLKTALTDSAVFFIIPSDSPPARPPKKNIPLPPRQTEISAGFLPLHTELFLLWDK